MDLRQYLEINGNTQSALVEAINADAMRCGGKKITQSAISQWLNKNRLGVPADRVLQLVRVSDGAMTAAELRPDLFASTDLLANSDAVA